MPSDTEISEPTPAKQQKIDDSGHYGTPTQKSASDLLAEITSENQNNNPKVQHGLDLHGKTVEQLNKLLEMTDLSKNQQTVSIKPWDQ